MRQMGAEGVAGDAEAVGGADLIAVRHLESRADGAADRAIEDFRLAIDDRALDETAQLAFEVGGFGLLNKRAAREPEVGGFDHRAFGQQNRVVDDVFEFADIARPGMALKQFHGLRAKGQIGPPQPFPIEIEEIMRQRLDVGRALSQGGQPNRGDVQAKVEVFAKMLRLHRRFQIHIRRRDDADIDANGTPRPDANDLALLQHPKQLDLQGQRQVADLVEHEGAPPRRLEPAKLRLEGAGERAFFVAEQLGLGEGIAEGAAIYGDERPRRACAAGVNVARRQLLAGARLPDDENRRLARRDAVEIAPQGQRGGILEHHCGRPDRILTPAPRVGVEGHDFPMIRLNRLNAGRGRRP